MSEDDPLHIWCNVCDYEHGYTYLGDAAADVAHAKMHEAEGVVADLEARGDYAVVAMWMEGWKRMGMRIGYDRVALPTRLDTPS